MAQKEIKLGQKTALTDKSSTSGEFDIVLSSPRSVDLSLELIGEGLGLGDWIFLVVFNSQVLIETKWEDKQNLYLKALPLNLKESSSQSLIAEQPLIFLIRYAVGKVTKEPDPLLNTDNCAGATVDLFPLILGENDLFVEIPMIYISTGIRTNCAVKVTIKSIGDPDKTRIPLMLTMISAHCIPSVRDGTVFISAIGLNDIFKPIALKFGMSLSSHKAKNIVWASVSNSGFAANTAFHIPNEDKFIPPDLQINDTECCNSFYWNAMKRVLVDPIQLRERLKTPFLIDIAGVPRGGKIDVRGRYMAFVDAAVLLEPGQFGVTTCAKLLHYNEANLPDGLSGLLDLPPSSAKISARDTDLVIDENGHTAYIVLRFDLFYPLTAKAKISSLYEIIGFPPPEGSLIPVDELYVDISSDDSVIDVSTIKKECGALYVHKELSSMASKGSTPFHHGTLAKRTAANRLLLRLRSMLKRYPPDDNYSSTEGQNVIMSQHAACRRAVTSSFAPQPPHPRLSSPFAAARYLIAGDKRIADHYIEKNLEASPGQSRPLLAKVLRLLEEKQDDEAYKYLLKALSAQTRNRYLLWLFGGTQYANNDSGEIAAASFRIAVKGDTSDGTTGAIGWAALHALHHSKGKIYAAFIAARKMRKAFELPKEWKKFYQRWIEISGEEEKFWIPHIVDSRNPILIAAAFFLCLRCYKFSERLLKCLEEGCLSRGSRIDIKINNTVDIYYLRVASLLLRRHLDEALDLTNKGIKHCGPSAMMSQMRAVCLTCLRGWDGECEGALIEAERAGAEICPSILLQAALGGLKSNPLVSLQRAARAHRISPSAHSALTIGRVYAKLKEEKLAERWLAAAVNLEPLLCDGWAFLALLAMYDRNLDKAKVMLRTAKQAGPISPDIEEELRKISKIVRLQPLPDSIVKDICFCEYF